MATQAKCFEQYPSWIVLLSNLVSIAIYAIGAYLMYQLGGLWLGAYIGFLLSLELRVMKKSCPNCFYYGRTCAFGKGRLSALLFKKGSAKAFTQCKITWKDILPDFLVSVIPALVGAWLLVNKFDFFMLLLIILLIALATVGSAFVRGQLACKHCKQRKLGCPAEKLFKKSK